MATLMQFSRNIRKIGSRIENNSVALTKRVAKKALTSLVEGTPVDKGVARSNWRVSLTNPTSAVIEAYSPGKKLGISERRNAKAAIAEGKSVIDRLSKDSKRGTNQAGSAVYISNSIPYLDKLRNGYSKQQPNDWVSQALLEAQEEIPRARLLDTNVSDE